mgnify:CR=1 FL=1
MLPASIKRAPFKFPKILKRCSALKASFRFASLNSLVVSELPGPKLYADHARLSLGPPPKKLFANGILFEFP